MNLEDLIPHILKTDVMKFTPKATIFFILTTLSLIVAGILYAISEKLSGPENTARAVSLGRWSLFFLGGFIFPYVLWLAGAISLREKQ